MPVPYSSRELSERVEIDFQKRPNKFRRRVWWVSLWLGIACLLWVGFEAASGEYRLYEGGQLAGPHRFFENDCAKCHTTWAPLERVVRLDFGTSVSSVENSACLKCHPGSLHHENQSPAHDKISCAHCHVDHRGNHDLKRVANHLCLECHRELNTTTGPSSFVASVTDFSRISGHPEFAVNRLKTEPSSTPAEMGPAHGVFKLLKFDEQTGWHDRAAIRFNHAAHLRSERDSSGQLVYGLIGKDQRMSGQRFSDLSQTCSVCHQIDDAGRYMRSIQFEQHCRECHPLYFDNKNFPQKEVPHETPEVVRGFLTEQYTLSALRNSQSVETEQPARPVPGRGLRSLLSHDQVGYVEQQLKQAEQSTLRHQHVFFGKEAKGGCAYCHSVESDPQSIAGDGDASWKIVPPGIPDRWQPHARFNHQIHALLNCAECHGDVDQSKLTSDVLLPSVEVCRKCHSTTPEQPGAGSPARLSGARTDCVECHNYHDHSRDTFNGSLNPALGKSSHTKGK